MGLVNRLRMNRLKAHAAKMKKQLHASLTALAEVLKRGNRPPWSAIRLSTQPCRSIRRVCKLLFNVSDKTWRARSLLHRQKHPRLPYRVFPGPALSSLASPEVSRAFSTASVTLGSKRRAREAAFSGSPITLKDLNGVSVTLQEVARIALARGLDLKS